MSGTPLKTTRYGRCNCAKIKFSVTGIDKLAVHCYCVNCQRSTGSAFAHNHRYADAVVKFDEGKDLVKMYEDGDTESGRVMYRHFCGNCGSPLFLKFSSAPNFIAIHEGSTCDDIKSQPVFEFFSQEKHAWLGNMKGLFRLARKYNAGIDGFVGDHSGPALFPWDPQT